ncbi:MAG: argininosuccinate lyase [Candidatus Thermoplasmatota archaeon]
MSPRSTRNRASRVSDAFLGFTGSVHYDRRLWKHDIAGSIAHVHALAEAGVVTAREKELMVSGLRDIAAECSRGTAAFDPRLEDVHMNIERMLTDRVGEAGAKLHTGRSRNDQVALDMRLMVRESLVGAVSATLALQEVLLRRAREADAAPMPGYTHLQRAQPVLLSHHLLAHFWRLERDVQRMAGCYARANVSPLGAGALAGTAFGIDRSIAARMLAMDGVTENSLDSVSDRDFVAEAAFALSLLMVHLSSLSEELVLWSSQEFGFVRLPEGLSSGSSMMPQKRNPDIPELVRGKSGRTIGHLVAILTMLKSLPLAYNRDLQEDKENLFDVFDTVGASLHALTDFLADLEFDVVRMRESAEDGLMTATDLADFLATRGIPFRAAHGIVQQISERSGGDPHKFRELAAGIEGVRRSDLGVLELEHSLSRRRSQGGTAPSAVAQQAKRASSSLSRGRRALRGMKKQAAAVDRLVSG